MNVIAFVRSEESSAALRRISEGLSGARIDVKVLALKDLTKRHINGQDAVLVEFDPRNAIEVERLKHIVREELPKVPVLVGAAGATLEDVRRIMSLGVVDVLSVPFAQMDLAVALDHAARRRHHTPESDASRGKVITFIKGGGGVGCTTVAVQGGCVLASEAKQKSSVCLLDLDIQFGTAGLYLDLNNPVGLFDLLGSPDRLDLALLSGAMTSHDCGLDVLLSPRQMVTLEAVTPDFVDACVRTARERYDYVLIDVSPVWTDWTHAALQASDMNILVTQLGIAGIRQTMRQLETIASNGLSEIPLKLIANRHDSRWHFGKSAEIKDAENALGRAFDFMLPNDFRLISEAISHGVPVSKIARKSGFEKSLRGMFREICAELSIGTQTRHDTRAVA